MKWYTQLQIIDQETGEILTKSEYQLRNLEIKSKEIKYENKNENTTIRIITWLTGKPRQYKLWED